MVATALKTRKVRVLFYPLGRGYNFTDFLKLIVTVSFR